MNTKATLIEQQAATGGAVQVTEITYADLTDADAAQTLSALIAQKAGVQALRVLCAVVVTPFVSSDPTLVSTTVTVGDAGSANRYLTSLELNAANATPPVAGQVANGALASTAAYIATADTNVTAAIACTAGKALNTHTAGRLLVYWQSIDGRNLG